MGKRIRYPKKIKDQEQKSEIKNEKEEKEKNHFVLDVHNSVIGGNSKIGR